ncbi:MAG: glycosyltransferase [Candidatus Nitrospinota bacterium M3_3B_026]
MTRTPLSILHLPTAVGGAAWGLRCAERALGHRSDCLVADRNSFDYPADIRVGGGSRVTATLARLRAFMRLRKAYDVFHFNFGTSLISFPTLGAPLLDLGWYPERAVKVVTYQGCDARMRKRILAETELSACQDGHCDHRMCRDGDLDRFRDIMIAKMDAKVDHIFALNPDLLRFLPGRAEFLPYTIASWDDSPPRLPARRSGPLVVVHAPSNRAVKGTSCLLEAVSRIERSHPGKIQLDLVEGVPHHEALARYAAADVVVDQLLIGWYGALSVEAMRMGVPVICYLRRSDFSFLPAGMADDLAEAVTIATPQTLEEALLTILENRETIAVKSEAARAFVHKWHDPEKIARHVVGRYEEAMERRKDRS